MGKLKINSFERFSFYKFIDLFGSTSKGNQYIVSQKCIIKEKIQINEMYIKIDELKEKNFKV